MKRLFFAATSIFALTMPQVVKAQSPAPAGSGVGLYIEGFIGLTILDDFTLDSDIANADADITNEIGGNLGGALGVILPLGLIDLRLEGELAVRGNATEEVDNVVLGEGDPDDAVTSAISGMANAHADLRLSPQFALTAGAGIGYANVTADIEAEFDDDLIEVVDGDENDDNVLAYQLMTGVRYNIDANSTISLGYRYFVTDDVKVDISGGGGETFEFEYATHNFNLGYAYRF